MVKPIVFILFFCFASITALATHIMGGTIAYKYVSSTANDITYEITLQMYRDCRGGVSSTVQFGPEINIGIYHNNTAKDKYKTEKIKLASKNLVNITNCYAANFCVEAGTYIANITFDKSTVGYYLVHEVCCRSLLTNLKDNGSTPDNGYSFFTFIPPTAIINNSPVFDFNPTLIYGANKVNEDNWGAKDTDGDSLIYNIVAPYKSGSTTFTAWDPPNNMLNPVTVAYISGYSFAKPFGNTGNISIDQTKGQFSFSNSSTGFYAFCVEIKEYRKGALIGIHRKDYPLMFINTPPESGFNIKLLHPQFVTNKLVGLSWQICPNSFPTYSIERKEKSTAWAKIGESFTRDNFINNIANNTLYYYRVKAMISSVEYISNIDSAYMALTGINKFSKTVNSTYPNPAKDYLHFNNPSVVSYTIYDVAGRVLLETNEISNSSEVKIDIRSLKQGLYFVVLKTEIGLVGERFVKE